MDGEVIEISGQVSAVIYQNPENGYAVLRLSTKDGVITAAGHIPGAAAGERLRLIGDWTVHPSYGEQFKTEAYEHITPDGVEEIYKYLASGAIKNVGPASARKIVEEFGSDSLLVIENEPEKLARIKGITMKTAQKISEGYRQQAGLRRLIDFLGQHNIKPVVATRVYKDYGETSLDAINTNPYIIAGEPYGAKFTQTDALAIAIGFESDSPERVTAAVLYELTHNLQNGHTFIERDKLVYATGQLISVDTEPVEDAVDMLNETGDVILESLDGHMACYLAHMHEAESYVTQWILTKAQERIGARETESEVREIERLQGFGYAPAQRAALELAVRSTILALTGGPGTGKTTTVRGILTLFDTMGLRTALCAPTGRAAKRLSETCRREAATIHRLLGVAPGDDGLLVFAHDESDPIRADAVIVDESSMIDILLMRALLSALPHDCRLVLVGDADQLPSVGPGCVFSDILRSGVIPSVSLSEIFRQAAESGIVKNAHRVNNGLMPELREKFPDFFFIRRTNDAAITDTIAELFSQRLPNNMGISPNQIQVLSPTRKQTAGTVNLNQKLREAVNPKKPGVQERQSGDFLFRTGDKVMQIKNNYDIMWKALGGGSDGAGVYNGDVGIITDIDTLNETVIVEYEDKVVTYLFEQLTELEPAFAMTVHKSQGSEYHAVILAVTNGAPGLMTRGILYTAMTRARKILILVGDPAVIERMVKNDKRQRRYSGLRIRLKNGHAALLNGYSKEE